MELKVSPAGKYTHDKTNFQWVGCDVMKTCYVAGHEMMLIQKSDDEPHLYELHYMGYMTENLVGIDEAKNSAQAFAFKVLEKLVQKAGE